MASGVIELIVALEPEVQAGVIALIRAIKNRKHPAKAIVKAQAAVDEEPINTDLEN